MRFNSPLARRLFWIVFISVTLVTYIVMPVTAMYFMRDIAIKAVAAYREDATPDTVDKLVGLVLLVSKIGWIPLLINSISSLTLAVATGYLVSRPAEGMHRNVQDLIHDLRGPISGIVRDAEIAIDMKKDSAESLQSILAKAEALLATYDLNAEIVRNYDGTDREKVSDFDLVEIIEDYATIFGDIAEEKGVRFLVSHPLHPVVVRAHSDKIRRLVANLVDNAVKYTESGSVSLSLEVKKSKFTLTVADTGVGMSEEEKSLMFNDHYRAVRAKGKPGIGHGLAMVGSIMKFYGSKPKCDSTQGKGTTFTITLPLDLTPRKPILRRAVVGCGRCASSICKRIRRALGCGEPA